VDPIWSIWLSRTALLLFSIILLCHQQSVQSHLSSTNDVDLESIAKIIDLKLEDLVYNYVKINGKNYGTFDQMER